MPGASRVVAGISGSRGSLAALRYAEYLALSHGAVLVPVLAWQPPGGDRAARVQREAGLLQAGRDMACQRLGEALAAVWGGSRPEPLMQPQVEPEPPGWVLVSIADHPGDVLVLGAGLQSITLEGSVLLQRRRDAGSCLDGMKEDLRHARIVNPDVPGPWSARGIRIAAAAAR